MAQRELTDAEVFGTSDAEVFGTTATQPKRTASESAEQPLPRTVAPPAPSGPQPQSLDQALFGIQAPNIGSVSPAVADAASRVAQAGVEGWQATPDTQPVRDMVTRNLGISAPIINQLIAGAGGVLGALSGGYRAAQQAGVELISPLLGGQAARDIVSIPDAFGGAPGTMSVPGRPPIPEAPRPSPSPRFAAEIPAHPSEPQPVWRPVAPGEEPVYGREYRMNQNTGQREVNVGGPVVQSRGPVQGVPEPEPPPPVTSADVSPPVVDAWVGSTASRIKQLEQENAAAGGPQSLSAAATPPADAAMAPSTVKAHRRMAELNRVVSPIEGEDFKTYVEGSIPTQAEGMGHPEISQKEVMTRQRNPAAFEGEQGRLTLNNRARIKAYDETMISPLQADDLKIEQQAAAQKAHQEIMATAKDVDLRPVARWVEEQLADPRIREIEDVNKTLTKLRDTLYDANGNLKTDPGAAWGMHDNLRNLLQKGKDPMSATSAERFAMDQINDFKKRVDAAMVQATDGKFQGFLDEQSNYLKKLNAYQLMQEFRDKKMIKRSDGTIDANAFHRFVTDLGIRRGKPGVDAAMDIPDEVFQRLLDINDDLKRAARIDMGKPRGSPTNLFFELASSLGIAGTHAITAAATSGTPLAGIANVGVQTGLTAIQRRMGARRLHRMTQEALEPPQANRLMGGP